MLRAGISPIRSPFRLATIEADHDQEFALHTAHTATDQTATDLQTNPQTAAPASFDGSSNPSLNPQDISLKRLLQVKEIYYEPSVLEYPRGQEILSHYPDACQIEVASHWKIPDLHGNEDSVEDWNLIKRTVLVLGVKKSIQARPNDRSADFIAPSHSNGCAAACSYCVATGTLISTPRGQVPVEQIQNGDEVFAYDSSSGQLVKAVVSGTTERAVDEVLEIQVGDTVLRVTAEHPIMTRREWVRAGDLTEDDEVLCDDDHIG